MLIKENNLFCTKNILLSQVFNRILVTDSTILTLQKEFYSDFRGAWNEHLESTAKIQLQFDLFSGNFTYCEVQEGIVANASYTSIMIYLWLI